MKFIIRGVPGREWIFKTRTLSVSDGFDLSIDSSVVSILLERETDRKLVNPDDTNFPIDGLGSHRAKWDHTR